MVTAARDDASRDESSRDDSPRAHASASAPTLRIGVVTTSYPRVAGEAAGNFVGSHVAAMRALRHDVEVIAAGDPRPDDRDTTRIAAGTEVMRDDAVTRIPAGRLFYRGGAPDELERSPRAWLDAAWFTARLSATVTRRARDWDLIVAHWLAPSAIAALPTRTPLLAIAHGGDIHTLRRLRLLGPVLRLLRKRGARIAFVSDELLAIARAAAPSLAPWLDEAAIVQPMGLDVAHFASLGRAPITPPTILVVGRLVPIKGVDVALAAMPHVRTHAHLVIAGDGPERAALETRATNIGVTFRGAVNTAERDHLLRHASVVIVPSRVLANGRTEGMPMIALEALAAGVPVIASDVGGLQSLAGITRVPSNDPRALATAIDRVLGSSTRPILDGAMADLDWPHVAANLLSHAAR